MDKQLIERIAHDVAVEIDPTGRYLPYPSTTVEFASAFLARIDAERGKEAVAWWDGQYNDPRFSLTGNSFGVDERPLFLSPTPTIPEGMRLVPIEPTPAMCDVIRNEHDIYGSAEELYSMVLQAAQGEK